jgi:hypothetical protein
MPSVLFATKCWEGDWLKMASGGFKRKVDSLQYPFDATLLVINNVKDEEAVKNSLEGVSTYLLSVSEALQGILSSFNLKETDFIEPKTGVNGFLYAIGELAAVYGSKGYDYLCYLQGDCLLHPSTNFVEEAIAVLEKNPNIAIVSPYSEVNTWADDKDLDQKCSDQCFVVRVNEFLSPIYSYMEPYQPEYPEYGGRSFEYMVGQYLINTNRWRMILRNHYVLHPTYG